MVIQWISIKKKTELEIDKRKRDASDKEAENRDKDRLVKENIRKREEMGCDISNLDAPCPPPKCPVCNAPV